MKKQKFISKKWFIILAIVLLLIPMTAYAQPVSSNLLTGTFDEFLKGIAGFLNMVMKVLQTILWPIMMGIGSLLGNDLLFGAGMEERILQIWVQIRNFVNIGFVLVLLFIAIYNVLGIGKDDNYALKTTLPKVAVAIIAVNFSFIIIKVLIDLSSVLTVAAFTLPSTISEDLQRTTIVTTNADGTYKVTDPTTAESICKMFFGDTATFERKIEKMIIDKKLSSSSDAYVSDKNNKVHCKVTSLKKYEFTEFGKEFFAQFTSKNASLVLAIQMMNVIDVDKVSEKLKDAKTINIQDITFNLLFSVILYFVFATAYLAMFVVLLIRIIILWVLIVISPLYALKIIFGDKFRFTVGNNTEYKEVLIKLLTQPPRIGVIMTIGFLMLGALKNLGGGAVKGNNFLELVTMQSSGITDLQSLIIAVGAVSVVWMGVFDAMSEIPFAGEYTNKIKGWVESNVRDKAFEAVKLLPFIPIGEGKNTSIRGVEHLLDAPLNKLRGLPVNQGLGGGGTTTTNKQEILNAFRSNNQQQVRDVIGRSINNKEHEKLVAEKLKSYKDAGSWKGRIAQQFQQHADINQAARVGLTGVQRGHLRPIFPATAAGTAYTASRAGNRTGGAVTNQPATTNVQTVENGFTRSRDIGFTDDLTQDLEYKDIQKATGKDKDTKAKKFLGTKKGKQIAAIDQNFQVLKNVQGSGQAYKSNDAAKAGDLDAKLKAADTALQSKLTNVAERQEVLKKILQKALGTNYNDYINKSNTTVKNYVGAP